MDTTQESTYDTVFASIFRNANGTKPTPENLRMKATLEAISSVIVSGVHRYFSSFSYAKIHSQKGVSLSICLLLKINKVNI